MTALSPNGLELRCPTRPRPRRHLLRSPAGVLALLAVSPAAPFAQEPPRPSLPPTMAQHLQWARRALSGERARSLVAFMDTLYRVPGNRPFDASLQQVVEVLRQAGYREAGDSASASETQEPGLTYRIERRPLDRPAWEPVSASLTIAGQEVPLLTLRTNLNLVAANSFSTPPDGVEAEVVDVGGGTPAEFDGKEVAGKVVLGDAAAGTLFRAAVLERGALGVLAYRLAPFNRPEVNRDIAPMASIPYDPEGKGWALLLTTRARDELRHLLREQGTLRVHVDIRTRIYPAEELTLVAEVRGRREPQRRLVFSAHVQESGANDNASGVAALAEMARVFAEGVRRGAFVPERTITMIWGDEIRSTRRFLADDPGRAAGVMWGISLDMVGQDTEKTGGSFLIEKMPDPSAVWTRGDDRHTEWGGRPLPKDRLRPHYLNDLLRNRCLDQARLEGWIVGVNPFEGGSDHVPFLDAGIPAVLLWHFTDQFYHTDGDRLDKVSARTLWNVAVCATTAAMALVSANEEVAVFLLEELERDALERLERESALSRNAIRAGGTPELEREILQTWTDWYLGALRSAEEIQVGGPSSPVLRRLQEALERVAAEGRRKVEALAERRPG